MNEIDVVVIGAGAAGVAAARRLVAARIPVLVLEARGRVGGRAWTMREASGLGLDLGCGWLHSADENEWAALAPTLGMTVDRTAPPWGAQRRTIGFAPGDLEDFRAAAERFFARLEQAAESVEDIPAAALLEPGERWNPLINALSTYISGVELDQVSVRDLGNYHDSGENWRVLDGYGALVEAYAAPLDVRLDCPATLIDHAGPRLRIETPQGVLVARAAIVTVPTSMIAHEKLRFAPALPDKLAAAERLPLGLDDTFVLHIDRPEDVPVETRLFGAPDRDGTGSFHLRPFGRPVIECYFGGKLARALEAEPEVAFARYAVDQIAAQLGGDIRSRLRPIFGSAWGRDPWALGAYSYARPGDAGARPRLAAGVDDRLFFAGEACSTHDYSTAHGAYRTGVKAAEEAIKALTS
ncbi:MAG TPA: NAD(P)/FAD-dependent oxidoreductase [Xanthobacteraceae bacterium]